MTNTTDTTDFTTFTSRQDVQAHVLDALGSEGTEVLAYEMTELLYDEGLVFQAESGAWVLTDVDEATWLRLLDETLHIVRLNETSEMQA